MTSPMGRLTAADESLHPRPSNAPETWQENCFIMGYDEVRDLCVYLHVEHHRDRVDVKAAVAKDGDARWVDADDDVWPDVVTPYEHLRVDWSGGGLSLDLELRSELPPIDHGAALDAMGLPGAERDHYEAVGRLTGTVSVDGAATLFDGVFWRDHTWGAREYANFGTSWWWPTALDGGRAYVSGVAVELGDRVVGYGLVADDDGLGIAAQVSVDVEGESEPGKYTAVSVSYEPEGRDPVHLRYVPKHHLCTTYPGFNVDRRWNDAFSSVTWGSRAGFGSMELGK
jgi:predicted secreted hydrolase